MFKRSNLTPKSMIQREPTRLQIAWSPYMKRSAVEKITIPDHLPSRNTQSMNYTLFISGSCYEHTVGKRFIRKPLGILSYSLVNTFLYNPIQSLFS